MMMLRAKGYFHTSRLTMMSSMLLTWWRTQSFWRSWSLDKVTATYSITSTTGGVPKCLQKRWEYLDGHLTVLWKQMTVTVAHYVCTPHHGLWGFMNLNLQPRILLTVFELWILPHKITFICLSARSLPNIYGYTLLSLISNAVLLFNTKFCLTLQVGLVLQ